MSKKFWIILRTYCLESTLVGLKYFYLYPDLLSRCFWAANLLTVLSMSCMITWQLYIRFKEMPTRITIENQYESVYNLPYPSITLCSPNQMTLSSLNYFNRTLVDGNLTIDLEKALPLLLGFYELIEDVDIEQLKHLQQVLAINRYTISEVMGKMPLSCERFLKRCAFEGELYDCRDLFRPVITNHGYCCTFNSKYFYNGKHVQVDYKFKNRTVKATGLANSLSVVSNFEPEDAIPGTLLNAGSIRVVLTDWTEYPVDYETGLLDTNAEAFLFIRATYTYCSDEVRSLPPDVRGCYYEEERHMGMMGLIFKHYRNSDCDHMCFVIAVWKSCDCWIFFLPIAKTEHMCKASKIPCIMDVKRNMSMWLMTEPCKCPRDCESRQYRVELTMGNFLAFPYLVGSNNPYRGLTLNTSTSIMNFFFTTPIYVKQKQETVMSIISLASNLGGVFGLFMGCSGISVLEIMFYIYRAVRGNTFARLGRQRNEVDYRR